MAMRVGVAVGRTWQSAIRRSLAVVQTRLRQYAAAVSDTPVPSPQALAPGTTSSGVRPKAASNLDDLERRLEAFDQATKRLARTVAPAEARIPTQMPASEFIAARDGSKDEPSGLRPAVSGQSPTTGALTARRSQAVGRPGFTSTIGRPQITPVSPSPPIQLPTPTARPATAMPHTMRTPRRWPLLALGLVAGAIGIGLLLLPGMFPVCPEGEVVARTVAVESPANGVLAALTIPVGTAVKTGDVIGRIDHLANVALGEPEKCVDIKAPVDGSVAVRLVAVGRQVAQGDTLLSLALPNTAAVVASLPVAAASRVAVGDRVEVSLIAENR
ncbi:MAG: HlyD family efflux transporter periplasmic adaptor subunit, partial [Planctomycetota bacterium]